MKAESKTVTLRIPAEQHAELEAVAQVEGISVNQAVNDAVGALIEAKRKDREFKQRLAAHMAEHKAVLDRLAK